MVRSDFLTHIHFYFGASSGRSLGQRRYCTSVGLPDVHFNMGASTMLRRQPKSVPEAMLYLVRLRVWRCLFSLAIPCNSRAQSCSESNFSCLSSRRKDSQPLAFANQSMQSQAISDLKILASLKWGEGLFPWQQLADPEIKLFSDSSRQL